MPFELEKSDRPSREIFAENTLLFVCVVALIPVALTVVGMIFIVPLLIGLKRSLKFGSGDSVRGTSKPIQFILTAILIIPLYHIYIERNKAEQVKLEMNEYNERFPYKSELEVLASMTPYDLTMKYGADEANRIARISTQRHFKNSDYVEQWGEHQREVDKQKIWFSIALFYLFAITFGWVRPLSNKIDRGELTFVQSRRQNKKTKIITGSEGIRGYSVADELIKWSTLREKGLVSNEEFETARKRLMSGANG